MIRVPLPAPEPAALPQAFRSTSDRKLRHRLPILLLAPRARPHAPSAEDLGLTPRTVPRWRNASLERGPDGLQPRWAPAAKPKRTADLAPLLQRWLIARPAAQGLDRANGTDAERADPRDQTRGVRVRKSALPAFCSRYDIRPSRPRYRFLRGDPVKQAAARQELAGLQQKPRRASWSC